MGLSIERGHIAGLTLFLLNMSLVATLGLSWGLALRSLLLLALDRGRPNGVIAWRALAAVLFASLGFFEYLFGSNMIVWDRPPRAVLVALVVAFPFVTLARHRKGSIKSPSARHGVMVGLVLFVLSISGVLSLLRAGTVALAGDRVTLTVDVTGEQMGGNVPASTGPGATHAALRHVVVWLPYGQRLADIWLPSERMRVVGRAYRLSKGLNDLGFPNLYEFLSVEGVADGPGGAGETVAAELPAIENGPVGVNRRWRPIQEWILTHWEAATSDDSFLALRTVPKASPYYPLVDGQGRAFRKTFLLVLTPSGNVTSRGSSPFEKDVPRTF